MRVLYGAGLDRPPATESASETPRERWSAEEKAAVLILVAALVARFFARPHAPFWIDEAATGALVIRPTFQDFWQNVYWHVSSPLYFLVLRGWSALAGFSNEALRFPSAVFSIAAPLCVALARLPGLSRQDRLFWAALVALWSPGIGYAQTARPYALEFLFATLQTLAFANLLKATTLRNTALWVGMAALTISTHCLASALALAQGVAFLGLRRREAVRQWPALLLILPAGALVLWQAPEMARFTSPDTTWYHLYTFRDVFRGTIYLFGGPMWLIGGPLLIACAAALGLIHRRERVATFGLFLPVALSSVVGATLLLLVATQRQILIDRYLAPFAPGVALLVVIALRALARGDGRSIMIATLLVGFGLDANWLEHGGTHRDSVIEPLNYQHASGMVMGAGVKNVAFLWDNPNARAMHPVQIANYGSFFFDRAGYKASVTPIQPTLGTDPNRLLMAAAAPQHAAIIWVYDTWVSGTLAADHPPSIDRQRWACDLAHTQTFGVLTCLPREAK